MSELLTKSDVLRLKGWSYEFFNALHVPAYHIGKRDYFTIEDVETAVAKTKQEAAWESTGSKGRRTGGMTSRFKAKGIGAARRLQKEAKLKQSTPNGAANPC